MPGQGNQGVQGKSDGTVGPSEGQQQINSFKGVMTSQQLLSALSQQAEDEELQAIAVLLDNLHAAERPMEQMQTAFMLRTRFQEYRNHYRDVQKNADASALIIQLDAVLFGGRIRPALQENLLLISVKWPVLAAFIQQVVRHKPMTEGEAWIVRAMLQWVKAIPFQENAFVGGPAGVMTAQEFDRRKGQIPLGTLNEEEYLHLKNSLSAAQKAGVMSHVLLNDATRELHFHCRHDALVALAETDARARKVIRSMEKGLYLSMQGILQRQDNIAMPLEQQKLRLSQLEHIWNRKPPDEEMTGWNTRYAGTALDKLNEQLSKERKVGRQLDRLKQDSDWLLFAADHHDDVLKFVTGNMKRLRKMGFTTLILEQLNTEDGRSVEDFLRTGGNNTSVLEKFLQEKAPSQIVLWQALLDAAAKLSMEVVSLYSAPECPVESRPAFASVWQQGMTRELRLQQLAVLKAAGKKAILVTDAAQLRSGDGFNGMQTGIARRLSAPILTINGTTLQAITDDFLATLPHFASLMLPQQLKERAYVPWKFRGDSYYTILLLLEKMHATQGRAYIETAFMLQNSLVVYREKYPLSPRSRAFSVLEQQLDTLLFDNDVMKLLAPEDKNVIRQMIKTTPVLAATLWQVVGSFQFYEPGSRTDFSRQLFQFVQDAPLLKMTGCSHPVEAALFFEATFHIPVLEKDWSAVKLSLSEIQKQGYLHRAEFSSEDGMLHLGYSWQDMKRFLFAYPQQLSSAVSRMADILYEAMNAQRMPDQIDENVMLSHFANKGYLGRLQSERLRQFEKGLQAVQSDEDAMKAWDRQYSGKELDQRNQFLKTQSLHDNVIFLLENYSGLLLMDREGSAFSVAKRYMADLKAVGITTFCISWLSSEHQSLIDDFFKTSLSAMQGDLNMLLTPGQRDFFNEARSLGMDIVALHHEQPELFMIDTSEQRVWYQYAAVIQAAERLKNLVQKGKKFIVMTDASDFQSYHLSDTEFLPGLARLMNDPVLAVNRRGQLSALPDDVLNVAVKRDIHESQVNVTTDNIEPGFLQIRRHKTAMTSKILLEKIRTILARSAELEAEGVIREAMKVLTSFIKNLYPVVSSEVLESALLIANYVRNVRASLLPAGSEGKNPPYDRYSLLLEEIYHRFLGHLGEMKRKEIIAFSHRDTALAARMYQEYIEQEASFVRTPGQLLDEVKTILSEDEHVELVVRTAFQEIMFFIKRFSWQRYNRKTLESFFTLMHYLYQHQDALLDPRLIKNAYHEFTAKQIATSTEGTDFAIPLGRGDQSLPWESPMGQKAMTGTATDWISWLCQAIFDSDFNQEHEKYITTTAITESPGLAVFLYESARKERDCPDRQGFTDVLISLMRSMTSTHLSRLGYAGMQEISSALEFAWRIHESNKIVRWDAKYSAAARDALNLQLADKNIQEQLSLLLNQYPGLLITAPVGRALYPLYHFVKNLPEIFALCGSALKKVVLVLDMDRSLQPELDRYMAQDDSLAQGAALTAWASRQDEEDYALFADDGFEISTASLLVALHDDRHRIRLRTLHDVVYDGHVSELVSTVSTASTAQALMNLSPEEKFVVITNRETLQSAPGIESIDGLHRVIPGLSQRLELPVLSLSHDRFETQADPGFDVELDRFSVAKNRFPETWLLPLKELFDFSSTGQNHYQLIIQLEDSKTEESRNIFGHLLTAQFKKDALHSLLVFLPEGGKPDFLIARTMGWEVISCEEARDIMMRWPPQETQMLLFGFGRETPDGQRELAGRNEKMLAEEMTKLNNKLITMGITLPESIHIKDVSWAGNSTKAEFERRFLSEKSQNWEGIPTLDQVNSFAAVPFKKQGNMSQKIVETLQEFWQHSNEGAGRVYRAKIAIRLWKEMNDYITRYPHSKRTAEFRWRKAYIARNIACLQTEARYQEEAAMLQHELKFLMQEENAEESLRNTGQQGKDDLFRVLTTQDLIRYRITQPAVDMLNTGIDGVYQDKANGRRYICIENNYYLVSGSKDSLCIIAQEEGAAELHTPRPGINVACNVDGQWGFNPHIGGRGGDADRTYLYRFLKDSLGDFIRKDLRAFLDDRAAELTAETTFSREGLLQALGHRLSILIADRLSGPLREENNPKIAHALRGLNNNEALHEGILHLLKRVFIRPRDRHALAAPDGYTALLREPLEALLAPELRVFARETERPLLKVREAPQENSDQWSQASEDEAVSGQSSAIVPLVAGQQGEPGTLKQRAARALDIVHSLQRQPLLTLDKASRETLAAFLAPENRTASVFLLTQLATDTTGIQALAHDLKHLIALDEGMQADYLTDLSDYDALEVIRKADAWQNAFMRRAEEIGRGSDTEVMTVPQQIYLNVTAPLSRCWQEANALGTGWVLNALYRSQHSTDTVPGGQAGSHDWIELMRLHTDISLRRVNKMALSQEINAAQILRQRLLDLNEENLWTAPQEQSLSWLSALSEEGHYRIESGRNLLFVEKKSQGWRLYDPRGALIAFTESAQEGAEQGQIFTDRLMAYLCTQNEALQAQSVQHITGIKHNLTGKPLFWVSRFELSRRSVQGAAHRFLTDADYFMADNERLHGRMMELGGEFFSSGQLLTLGIAETSSLPPDARPETRSEFSVDVHRLMAEVSVWMQIADHSPGSLAAQAATKALDRLDRAWRDPRLQEAKAAFFASVNASTSSTLPQGSVRTLAQSLAPAFDATQQGMMLLGMLSAISTLSRYHSRDPASLSAEEKEQYAFVWAYVGLTMTALAHPTWTMAVRGAPWLFRNAAPWATRLSSVKEVSFLRSVMADLSLREDSALISMAEHGARTLENGLKLLSSVSGLGFIALSGYQGYKDIQALLTETDPLKKVRLGMDLAACSGNTALMLVQMVLGRMGIAVPELLPVYAAIEATSRVTEATLRYEEQIEQYEKTLHLTFAEKIGVLAASWKGEQDMDVRERTLQVQELKMAVEEVDKRVKNFCARYQQALQKQAQTMDIIYNGENDTILRYRFLARRGLSAEIVGLFEFDFPAMMAFLQKQGITPERESSIQSLINDAVNHSGTYGHARTEKLATRMHELQNSHPELRLRVLNLQDFPELCKTEISREIPTPDWSWWDKFWYEMKSKFGLTPHSQTPEQMERISLHWSHSDPEALSPSRWHFRARGDRTLDAGMPNASLPDSVQMIRRSHEVGSVLAEAALQQQGNAAVKRSQILMRMASLEAQGKPKTIVMKGRQDADNTLEITGQDAATVQLTGGEVDDNFILNSALLKGGIEGGNGRNTLVYNAALLPQGKNVYQVTLSSGSQQTTGRAGSRGSAEWLTLQDIDHVSVPVVETDITGNSNANTLQASHGILYGKEGRDLFIVLPGSGQPLILRDESTEGDRISDVILPMDNDIALISRSIVERGDSADIVLTFRIRGNDNNRVEKSITLESAWKKSASDDVLLLNHEWNLRAGSLRLWLPAVLRKNAQHQWELPVLQGELVLPHPQQYQLLSTGQRWHDNTLSVSWQALDRETGEVSTVADSLQVEPGAVILSLTGMPGSEDTLIGRASTNNTFLNLQGGDRATGSVTGTDTFQLVLSDEETGIVTLLAGNESRLILPWSLQKKPHRLIFDDTGSLTLSQGLCFVVLQHHTSCEGPQIFNVLDSAGNVSVLWLSPSRKQAYLASVLLDVLPDGSFRVPQGHRAPVILHAATEPLRLDATSCTENVSIVDKTAQGGFLAGTLVAQNSILTLAGDYYLEGGRQADIIMSGEGDDSLVGGQGDDWLNGGQGRNNYYWQRGDGNDHIQDEGEDSQLVISGVDDASLQWEISAEGHLILLDSDSGARLTLYHGGTEQGGISTIKVRQQREGLGIDMLMDTREIRRRVTEHNRQANPVVTSENTRTAGISLPVDIPGNQIRLWPGQGALELPIVKLPWLFTQTDIHYADAVLVFMHAKDPSQHARFTLPIRAKEGHYAYLQDTAGDTWLLGQTSSVAGRVAWLRPQQQKTGATMNPDRHAAFMAALRSFRKTLLTAGSHIDARNALLRVDAVVSNPSSTGKHDFSLRDEEGNPVVLEVSQPISQWRFRQEGQRTTVLNFSGDGAAAESAEVRFTDLHAENAMPVYLFCRKEDRYWRLQIDSQGLPCLLPAGENRLARVASLYFPLPQGSGFTGSEADDTYLVPADGRQYRITDPAGQDTVILDVSDVRSVSLKRIEKKRDLEIKAELVTDADDVAEARIVITGQFGGSEDAGIERILVREQRSGLQYELRHESVTRLTDAMVVWQEEDPQSLSLHDAMLMKNKVMNYWQPVTQSILAG